MRVVRVVRVVKQFIVYKRVLRSSPLNRLSWSREQALCYSSLEGRCQSSHINLRSWLALKTAGLDESPARHPFSPQSHETMVTDSLESYTTFVKSQRGLNLDNSIAPGPRT